MILLAINSSAGAPRSPALAMRATSKAMPMMRVVSASNCSPLKYCLIGMDARSLRQAGAQWVSQPPTPGSRALQPNTPAGEKPFFDGRTRQKLTVPLQEWGFETLSQGVCAACRTFRKPAPWHARDANHNGPGGEDCEPGLIAYECPTCWQPKEPRKNPDAPAVKREAEEDWGKNKWR
jgi:hypothetical protein